MKHPLRALPVTLTLVAAVLLLPLMMGNRTALTLTASLAVLVSLAILAAGLAVWSRQWPLPHSGWLLWGAVLTVLVALQVWPSTRLVGLFGPYPEALLQHPAVRPLSWSPDPGASLRAWASAVALFTLAWLAYALPARQRRLLWLAIVAMALFQALYGLLALAAGSESIFGIWPRNNPGSIHGSFSNRNLFAAYMALTWPLAVCIWFIGKMPLIGNWPRELRLSGAVICAAIIGAAMLGSASRLGGAAGLFGMLLTLLLLGQQRKMLEGRAAWPAWATAVAAMLAATWYGLTPLAQRLLSTSGEEARLEVIGIMLSDFPRIWWLHGIGLGGFEAVFKQYQPASMSGWWDYAHNDLLQWLIETGLIGLGLLLAVLIALLHAFRLTTERVALYAGLAALGVVALGDFSWHIPATQVVLALFIGVLLAPASRRGGRRPLSGSGRRSSRTDAAGARRAGATPAPERAVPPAPRRRSKRSHAH